MLAVQASETEAGFAPVPESAATLGELPALLMMESLPVSAPVREGAYVTLKLVFWPAAREKGRAGPATLKPEPVTLACDIVTAALPVLVTTTGRMLLSPSVTTPKLSEVGARLRVSVVDGGPLGADGLNTTSTQ